MLSRFEIERTLPRLRVQRDRLDGQIAELELEESKAGDVAALGGLLPRLRGQRNQLDRQIAELERQLEESKAGDVAALGGLTPEQWAKKFNAERGVTPGASRTGSKLKGGAQ
jgi:hypothetical protein